MALGKGFALKFLQWIIRAIQLGCAAVALGIFAYFLASLHNRDLYIDNHLRAVTGISGAAVLYTLLGLLLLCCLAGFAFTSFIAIILDIAFVGAFIYVAYQNRFGLSSCGSYADTQYVRGNSIADIQNASGLPSYQTTCRMQRAVFSVSIIAIVFFLLSAVVEIFLVRNRKKEKRFGPGPQNNYTAGSGKAGLFGRRRRRRNDDYVATTNDSHLPAHTHPNDVRQSYNTEATAVGNQDHATYNKYGESGYGHANDTTGTALGAGNAAGAGYGDGYVNDSTGYTRNTGYNTATAPQQGYQPYRYDDGVYNRA